MITKNQASKINKAFSMYQLNRQNSSRWKLANDVLYNLCNKYPTHCDADEIVTKVWLIGRSYAAAIERRKNAAGFTGDFYYDCVAPELINSGSELDKRINSLNSKYSDLDWNSLADTLELHGYLQKIFNKLTGMDKRSLASKYLHFHCPSAVCILDSIVYGNVVKLVKKDGEKVDSYLEVGDYDPVYTDFCVRFLELREYIYDTFAVKLSLREMDDFLLFC